MCMKKYRFRKYQMRKNGYIKYLWIAIIKLFNTIVWNGEYIGILMFTNIFLKIYQNESILNHY